MRRASTLALLLLSACPEKPAPLPAPPQQPLVRHDPDAGHQKPSHLRPAPTGGEVKKQSDGTLVLSGHTEAILSVAMDAAGKRVATAGLDRSVRLWDVEHGKLLWAVGPGDEAVTTLAFDPTGALLAAGDRAFQVRLLQLEGGALARRRAHPDAVSSVAFSPDGKWLAVGGSGGNAEIYPAGDDGPSTCEVRGRTVDFSDGGKSLVSATPSGNLVVTSFPACKKLKETSTSPHLPHGAASGSPALVGTRNGAEPFVLLWDALQGRMLGKLDRQTGGVTSLQLTQDGKRALVASDDKHVRLYQVEKREVLKTFETGALPFAAMNADASLAVVSDGIDARVVSLAP